MAPKTKGSITRSTFRADIYPKHEQARVPERRVGAATYVAERVLSFIYIASHGTCVDSGRPFHSDPNAAPTRGAAGQLGTEEILDDSAATGKEE